MMNRQQVSWLIVRAFGLYLLFQAFMLVPELLTGIYTTRAYNNIMSSLGDGSTSRMTATMYRNLLLGLLLRIVLFSAVGTYLRLGGAFLVRLLDRAPNPPTEVGNEGDAQQIVGPERR
jgi:uncharacterized membrane protein YjgN (DUF898 family)